MRYIEMEMPKAGQTAVVGMSGGVDSTLTALLLKEKGIKTIGVTMSLWDGHLPEANSREPHGREACYGPGEEENIESCRKFCLEHDIPYYVIKLSEQYNKSVLEYFKNEYRAGRTPNPCIQCNRYLKFGALIDGIRMLKIDFDYFCTGHYAKIVRPERGIYGTSSRPCMIACAADITKDQTYFLYRIPSKILEKVRFPLASFKKKEVFDLAKKAGLEAAMREESQDFISGEYLDALFADKPSIPGDIIDLDGHVLGKHRGIEHYTIGQRKGLGVSVSYPVYVQAIDAKKNLIVLAPNDALNSSALIADDFVWPGGIEPIKKGSNEDYEALVKIRLAAKPVKARISRLYDENEQNESNAAEKKDIAIKNKIPENHNATENQKSGKWLIKFEEPQRAVTPGQSAVLYKDGIMIGGGIIIKAIK